MRSTHLRFFLACGAALLGACSRTGPAPVAAYDPASDDRLAHLYGACARTDPFTGDTTDLLPVLVRKLATAESHAASRARADILAAGAAATPLLRRAFQDTYSEPGTAPRLLAWLDLAAATGGEEARAMALEALEHPSDSIRVAGARLLQRAGSSADYARLESALESGSDELAAQAALALAKCDPARAARELASWLAHPRRAALVDSVIPYVATQFDGAGREALLADARASETLRTWLSAAATAAGDAGARADLEARLASPNPVQRQVALQAATAAGLADAAARILARDPEPQTRALALEALAREPDTAARRETLLGALSDADLDVRRVALSTLCERRDARALDLALEMLADTSDEVTTAMGALRAPMQADPELAERVLARLADLLEGGGRSSGRALERAIGQVPLARAAQILLELGRTETEPIQDLPPHRWHAVQASNAGPAGRAWLRAQWALEPDPLRRLDLISAGAQETTAAAEEFLTGVLESARATDPERVLAADLLARSVPAERAAPRLKQAAPAVTDPAARRALHCLLWRFYGP